MFLYKNTWFFRVFFKDLKSENRGISEKHGIFLKKHGIRKVNFFFLNGEFLKNTEFF